jgi:LuxR family transcriptional regulator, maltose regulon positive regulatory protein
MPPPRAQAVLRPRLLERLSQDHEKGRALTLLSAPAGFGKSTLLSTWIGQHAPRDPSFHPAWISLDEGDSDPFRFLLYVAAAVHGVEPGCGADAMAALLSPRPPSAESILTDLVNEIDGTAGKILLVLDDYHAVHSAQVDEQLAFLLEHPPARLRLVIATREDPNLPLARLRARGGLSELRAAELRFTPAETADFLGRVIGLALTAQDIAVLESRTEGWIAGLQLAALSMQGQADVAGFIRSFSGSHRFVLDYLAEEVLRRQPGPIQAFLLRTSILDSFCGSLCDALLQAEPGAPPDPGATGQETLEYLERSNLFIVPLDTERRWYRYHRLFADLLRQRLEQSLSGEMAGDEVSAGLPRARGTGAAALHLRASSWYEAHGLPIESFRHAAAAGDIDRAERLISSRKMPLHFRGGVMAVLDWLASLPADVVAGRPSLQVLTAMLSLAAGRTTGVEEALDAAEAADPARRLTGRIAAARATLAVTRYQPDAIMKQSCRAREHLGPDDGSIRFTAMWTMAIAHILLGDRASAARLFAELESGSRAAGEVFFTQLALCGLAEAREMDTRLHEAAQYFRRALESFGENPHPSATEVHFGLARILYEWNDLDAAEEHGERALQLARQYDSTIDRFILSELFLARLMLARGNAVAAAARLDELMAEARRRGFLHRLPEIAAVHVSVLLRLDRVEAASQLAEAFDLPQGKARVFLARGDPSSALALLEPIRSQVEARGWHDERLKLMSVQALAIHAQGREDDALHVLAQAMDQAAGGGFIRLFVDEGAPMAELLSVAAERGLVSAYGSSLRAAFAAEPRTPDEESSQSPLSRRELEVLRLIAEGLSNQEICGRLFLALDTVKGHNRRIFDKLEVKRRTEAIARGRELGLL